MKEKKDRKIQLRITADTKAKFMQLVSIAPLEIDGREASPGDVFTRMVEFFSNGGNK